MEKYVKPEIEIVDFYIRDNIMNIELEPTYSESDWPITNQDVNDVGNVNDVTL